MSVTRPAMTAGPTARQRNWPSVVESSGVVSWAAAAAGASAAASGASASSARATDRCGERMERMRRPDGWRCEKPPGRVGRAARTPPEDTTGSRPLLTGGASRTVADGRPRRRAAVRRSASPLGADLRIPRWDVTAWTPLVPSCEWRAVRAGTRPQHARRIAPAFRRTDMSRSTRSTLALAAALLGAAAAPAAAQTATAAVTRPIASYRLVTGRAGSSLPAEVTVADSAGGLV